jgi:hypothetical protein
VAALSVVFYFRNFHTSRQSSVVNRQSEQIEQMPVSNLPEVGRANKLDSFSTSSPQPVTSTSVPSTPTSALNTKHSTLNTQHSTISTHLFQLAREVYGNPFLWVLIYRANTEKISDPDQVIIGRDVAIPALEGTPDRLSLNDSVAVSDGYRMVYEYYLEKGDPRAKEFQLVMDKYNPR